MTHVVRFFMQNIPTSSGHPKPVELPKLPQFSGFQKFKYALSSKTSKIAMQVKAVKEQVDNASKSPTSTAEKLNEYKQQAQNLMNLCTSIKNADQQRLIRGQLHKVQVQIKLLESPQEKPTVSLPQEEDISLLQNNRSPVSNIVRIGMSNSKEGVQKVETIATRLVRLQKHAENATASEVTFLSQQLSQLSRSVSLKEKNNPNNSEIADWKNQIEEIKEKLHVLNKSAQTSIPQTSIQRKIYDGYQALDDLYKNASKNTPDTIASSFTKVFQDLNNIEETLKNKPDESIQRQVNELKEALNQCKTNLLSPTKQEETAFNAYILRRTIDSKKLPHVHQYMAKALAMALLSNPASKTIKLDQAILLFGGNPPDSLKTTIDQYKEKTSFSERQGQIQLYNSAQDDLRKLEVIHKTKSSPFTSMFKSAPDLGKELELFQKVQKAHSQIIESQKQHPHPDLSDSLEAAVKSCTDHPSFMKLSSRTLSELLKDKIMQDWRLPQANMYMLHAIYSKDKNVLANFKKFLFDLDQTVRVPFLSKLTPASFNALAPTLTPNELKQVEQDILSVHLSIHQKSLFATHLSNIKNAKTLEEAQKIQKQGAQQFREIVKKLPENIQQLLLAENPLLADRYDLVGIPAPQALIDRFTPLLKIEENTTAQDVINTIQKMKKPYPVITDEERGAMRAQLNLNPNREEQKLLLLQLWKKLLIQYPEDNDLLETVKGILRFQFDLSETQEYKILSAAEERITLQPPQNADPEKLLLKGMQKLAELEIKFAANIPKLQKLLDEVTNPSVKEHLNIFILRLEKMANRLTQKMPHNKLANPKEEEQYLNSLARIDDKSNFFQHALQELNASEGEPFYELLNAFAPLMKALSESQDDNTKSTILTLVNNTATTTIASLVKELMKVIPNTNDENRKLIENSYEQMTVSLKAMQELMLKMLSK